MHGGRSCVRSHAGLPEFVGTCIIAYVLVGNVGEFLLQDQIAHT